jgi:hypothetical protein
MNINPFVLIFSIIFSVIIGFVLCFWYMLRALKKATGVKSWKEFLGQAKKAQQMQKKMEKGGLDSLLSDPEIRKQMEEFKKKFKK